MAPVYDQVMPMAQLLLNELCCRLANSDGPVCRCSIGFGLPPAVAHCCECATGTGEAWVRVETVYPSTNFPQPESRSNRCDYGSIAAKFNLGIYRCAPALDSDGDAPAVEDMAAALARQLQDRAILTQTARCALTLHEDDRYWYIDAWKPIDPQGGCMGGWLTVIVDLEDCIDCDPCVLPEEGE